MELLEFSAKNYLMIARLLARMGQLLETTKALSFPDNLKKEMQETSLPRIRAHCDLIGLTMSIKSIDRFTKEIQNATPNAKIIMIKDGVEEISRRIEDEIEDNLFLYVPKTHVVWYRAENLFGAGVEQSFPSASYDVKESGRCLALHRNTAAVCHLMRVLEIGLRSLAKELNVPYENKPWNHVIEVADKRLSRIRGLRRKPRNWKVDEKFYSEALAHFRFLKDAWRNYSMHVFERYDEGTAESVFNHTKAFMCHLATKLKETS